MKFIGFVEDEGFGKFKLWSSKKETAIEWNMIEDGVNVVVVSKKLPHPLPHFGCGNRSN